MVADRSWLAAFDGIALRPGQSTTEAIFTEPDLAAALRSRAAVRAGAGNVTISVAALKAIAERIDGQSRALVEALGGSEPVLDEDVFSAKVPTGVLVRAHEGDERYEALYGEDGQRVTHNGGNPSNAHWQDTLRGYVYTVLDAPNLVRDDPAWPRTLDAVKARMAANG